jgi:CelD/BcsL family acetyltransferase involved in cellulose biosynthesis
LPHGKPGLTCHQLAIERALASGADAYDFLAGDDRYKRSLMTASQVMIWVELVSNGSLLGLLAQGRQLYHTLFNRPAGRACDCSSKT